MRCGMMLAAAVAVAARWSSPATAQGPSAPVACCGEPAATAGADGMVVAGLVRDLKSADEAVFQGAVRRVAGGRWGHAVDRAIVEMLLTGRAGEAPLTPARQVSLIRVLGACEQGCSTAVLKRKAADPQAEVRAAAQAALAARTKAKPAGAPAAR